MGHGKDVKYFFERTLKMDSRDLKKQLIIWRHMLHQNPETAFEEKKTAEFVAEKLKELGMEVHTGIGGTGVVASLSAGDGKAVIGIRADMDAINLKELSDHDHVSKNAGKMHGCGHDGHTATLLGAAVLLAETKNFNGTVRFFFQPAEEPGHGAKAMMDDGLFEKYPVDEIYGLHNAPFLPAGVIHTRTGGIMASEDNFKIRITGQGGHASSPHQGIDPLTSASQIYLALQTIVSRNGNPLHPIVISCTEWHTDGAHNAIPTHVEILGDTRSCSKEDQILIENRMREVSQGICTMNGAKCEFDYTHEFNPVLNDKNCVDTVIRAAIQTVGKEKVDENCEPWMASEDFAAYLNQVPGCFLLLGSGKTEENIPLHNAMFDYNDEVLMTGAELWKNLVEERLK
ncbi:M20 aminoacylase family protein [Anaerotignum sp.]|uniref:M20 aminoacylase family protein n=1 Tax=Anaerotignum sp. TaxID=2039241 RepID=UPI00271465A3|nr:M20 aminoacylase family protein [Anaerotignum sp.]